MGIAYFQPITRGELSQFFGREVSRDAIAALREEGLVAAGPRSRLRRALRLRHDAGVLGAIRVRKSVPAGYRKTAGRRASGRTGDALGGDALAAELRGVLGLGDEVEEDLGEKHVA